MFKTPIITTIFALLVHRICSAYKGGFRRRWIMEKDNINMLQDHGNLLILIHQNLFYLTL